MMLKNAKNGDAVILGKEEVEVVDGVLIVRAVVVQEARYSLPTIERTRNILDDAERLILVHNAADKKSDLSGKE
jgi:hypothetical protein